MKHKRVFRPDEGTPDLDYISGPDLRQLAERWRRMGVIEIGRELYPEAPVGVWQAARVLRAIVLHKQRTGEVPIEFYQRLPRFAQWRRRWNVAAAMERRA